MKGIEIFCASQASTAVCLSMDEASSSSSSHNIQLGGRAIDRHNPIIRDSRRIPSSSSSSSSCPSSPQAVLEPKPSSHQPQRAKKSSSLKPSEEKKRSSTKGREQKKKSNAGKLMSEHITNNYSSKPIESVVRRSWVRPPHADLITPPGSSRYLLTETSVVDGETDYDTVLALTPFDDDNNTNKKKKAQAVHHHQITNNYSSKPIESVVRRSWVRPPNADLITPPGSSRYLLTETSIVDGETDYDTVLALTPFDDDNNTNNKKKAQAVHHHQISHASKPSSSSLPKPDSSDQVVVLRVSLHCRGCEGKLRKHLSRMKGVSSFNIDFTAKKVTIVGDVTPLSILASVSKVKNAQFWPLAATQEASGVSETKK